MLVVVVVVVGIPNDQKQRLTTRSLDRVHDRPVM